MTESAYRVPPRPLSSGLPALSVYGIITSPADTDFLGLAAYCFCIGVLVGLLEIPQCCSCNRACVIMAKYLKYVSGYYIARALIYIGAYTLTGSSRHS